VPQPCLMPWMAPWRKFIGVRVIKLRLRCWLFGSAVLRSGLA
jgi:hypothetical protein